VGMAVKKKLLAPMQQWLAAYDVAQVRGWDYGTMMPPTKMCSIAICLIASRHLHLCLQAGRLAYDAGRCRRIAHHAASLHAPY
jgi:hypothetical protein